MMLLLDDTSDEGYAVDSQFPKNAHALSESIVETWPRLAGRIHYIESPVQDFEITAEDLVVSVHACGTLTDTVLEKAVQGKGKGGGTALLPGY